ncbi:MAG: diguanylate cyclase [Defluviitaleaceae bacterium]|nr:diguanylate cyclase [Defluviitaleaceae bacterium]
MKPETLFHIIDHTPMACSLHNEEYKVVHLNRAVTDLFGLEDPQEYIEGFDAMSPPYQPDGTPSRSKSTILMRDCLESGRVLSFDWLHWRKDKSLIPTLVTLTRVQAENEFYLMVFQQDMGESQQVRTAERVARQRMQAMLDSCPLACGIVDKHFNIVECNHEVINLFGVADKQIFINRFFEFSPEYQPDGRMSRQKAMDKLKLALEAGRADYEWLHQRLSGEQLPCEVVLVKDSLDGHDLAIIYIRDLREIKKSMSMVEKLESIAYTDELTKLFSRRYFMDNAAATLEVCKKEATPFHLIMADMDHFKAVNDTYGHAIGDEVLKIAAARMSNVTRQGTVISRYGGEEFIIMLTGIPYASAIKTAERIQKSIEESRFSIKGLGIAVTISLGIATLSAHKETLEDIIYMADVALYNAKRTGRNKVMEYKNAQDLNWLTP